jgi:hypothetical protein
MSIKPSIAKTSPDIGSALEASKPMTMRSSSIAKTGESSLELDSARPEGSFETALNRALMPKNKTNASKPTIAITTTVNKHNKPAGDALESSEESSESDPTKSDKSDEMTATVALSLPVQAESIADPHMGLNLLQLAQSALASALPIKETTSEVATEIVPTISTSFASSQTTAASVQATNAPTLLSLNGSKVGNKSQTDPSNNGIALAAQTVWPMMVANLLPMASTIPSVASKKEAIDPSTTEAVHSTLPESGLSFAAKMDSDVDFALPGLSFQATNPAHVSIPGLPGVSGEHDLSVPKDVSGFEAANITNVSLSTSLNADNTADFLSTVMNGAAGLKTSNLQAISLKNGKGKSTEFESVTKTSTSKADGTDKADKSDKASDKGEVAAKAPHATGITMLQASDVAKDSSTQNGTEFSQAIAQAIGTVNSDSNVSIEMTGNDKGNDSTLPTFLSNASNPTDQVMEGTAYSVKNGQRELIIRLNPDNLGEVKINLTSHANGTLSAKLIASSAESGALLSQQAESLQTSLEAKGVKVDKISVILAGQGEISGLAAASEAGKSQFHNSTHHEQSDSSPQQQSQHQNQNFQQGNNQHQMAQAFQEKMNQSQRQSHQVYGQPKASSSTQQQVSTEDGQIPLELSQRGQNNPSGQVSVLA